MAGLPLSVPIRIEIRPHGSAVGWKIIGDFSHRQIILNVASHVFHASLKPAVLFSSLN